MHVTLNYHQFAENFTMAYKTILRVFVPYLFGQIKANKNGAMGQRSWRIFNNPPQSRSFVYLLPLLPESLTSERLCQLTDVSEDIRCVSKDIVTFQRTFFVFQRTLSH